MTQKGFWNVAKKECRKMEEPCPKKTETLRNTLRTRKNFSTVGCGRMREENKSGNKEVEGKSEKVENSRRPSVHF